MSIDQSYVERKPLRLTFYDRVKDYPFNTSLYVRDDSSDTAIETLIRAICAVTPCVLAQYKIGTRKVTVPDFREQLEAIENTVFGHQKWVVKYRTISGSGRSFSIPGRRLGLSINAQRGTPIGKKGKVPDPSLPEWQELIKTFIAIGVSKEGEPIMDRVELDYRNERWPPRGRR